MRRFHRPESDYSVDNDLVFSAHTAIAVFAATELARLARRWLTLLGIAIAALYVAHVAERLSQWVDPKTRENLAPTRHVMLGRRVPVPPPPFPRMIETFRRFSRLQSRAQPYP